MPAPLAGGDARDHQPHGPGPSAQLESPAPGFQRFPKHTAFQTQFLGILFSPSPPNSPQEQLRPQSEAAKRRGA